MPRGVFKTSPNAYDRMTEPLAKIVNGFYLLRIFEKGSIKVVLQDTE